MRFIISTLYLHGTNRTRKVRNRNITRKYINVCKYMYISMGVNIFMNLRTKIYHRNKRRHMKAHERFRFGIPCVLQQRNRHTFHPSYERCVIFRQRCHVSRHRRQFGNYLKMQHRRGCPVVDHNLRISGFLISEGSA